MQRIIAALLLLSGPAFGQTITVPPYIAFQDVQTFTASGTWAKPAFCGYAGITCVTKARLIAGGPGGGQGAQETIGTAGSGGASGGGAEVLDWTALTSTYAATVSVTIGAGGGGGTGSGSGAGGP